MVIIATGIGLAKNVFALRGLIESGGDAIAPSQGGSQQVECAGSVAAAVQQALGYFPAWVK